MRVRATTRFKTMACRVCGTPVTVGSNTRKAPRCVECGIARMIEHNKAIVSKSGPDYELWRKRREAGIARELSARGIPTVNSESE